MNANGIQEQDQFRLLYLNYYVFKRDIYLEL